MKRSYDKHLNIFWTYNGKSHFEDNLTRALITTLSFSSKEQQIEFIKFLLDTSLDDSLKNLLGTNDEREISFDLQNPYLKVEEIKNAPKRFLIGINPSGKSWGEKYKDILDRCINGEFEKELLEKNSYEKYLKDKCPELSKELDIEDENGKKESEKLRDIILTQLNKDGSRPDGWIFIHKKEKLEVVIAIETKLWDLDPHQLANHCKNFSLNEIPIKIFKHVFDCIRNIKDKNNEMITEHFLDYMEKLGYYTNVERFTDYDFEYAFSNADYSILNRKFNKLTEKYFKSSEWEKLKEDHELRLDEKRKRIFINSIGEEGIGNIYFDTCFNKEKEISFFIGTEIGVSNKWYNEKFDERLKDDDFRKKLNDSYPKSENKDYESMFEMFLRINQCAYSDYIYLKEDKTLDNILNLKKENPYKNKLTKYDCIEVLKKYLKDSDNEYLQDKIYILEKRGGESIAENYNILSYLRFIDYIKQSSILEIEESDFNNIFNEILKKHIEGLISLKTNLLRKS